MILTTEEQDLLARRKLPTLTPRESLQSMELQTRILAASKAEGPERSHALAECEAIAAEIAALDFNIDGLDKINGVGQKTMDLHLRVKGLP